MAVALALGAALGYAGASVLQHRAAGTVPDERAMSLRLLWNLLHRPMWLAGMAADFGAFGLQAAALGLGSLLVVQPLVACGLLFALPLGAAWAGRRLTGADWAAAGALSVGLTVFLVVGDPRGGRDVAPPGQWLVVAATVGPVMAAALVAGMRSRGARRALFLAVVTGLAYGITAALTKSAVSRLADGPGAFFTSWEPYAALAVAGLGTLASQSAFQAGTLEASLPTLTVLEPIVSSVIGVTLFAETLAASEVVEWVAVGAATALMIGGVLALARSAARVEEALGTGSAEPPNRRRRTGAAEPAPPLTATAADCTIGPSAMTS